MRLTLSSLSGETLDSWTARTLYSTILLDNDPEFHELLITIHEDYGLGSMEVEIETGTRPGRIDRKSVV